MVEQRIVVRDITWVRRAPDSREAEVWYVDVPRLHVWVKNYGESTRPDDPDSPFSGWRIGVGGSPLAAEGWFANRQQAMEAGWGVVRDEAIRSVREAWLDFKRQLETAHKVGVHSVPLDFRTHGVTPERP